MILHTPENRWSTLTDRARLADEIIISSYNLYTGVSKAGSLIRSTSTLPARNFMNQVNRTSTRILIGTPPRHFCTPNCADCKIRREDLFSRYENHALTWPLAQIRFTKELHLKLYLFRKGDKWCGFTGGANLSSSSWDDILIAIPEEDIPFCKNLFEERWSQPPTDLQELFNWSF